MLVFWDIDNAVRELTFRGCSCGAKSLSLLRQLSMRVNRPVFPVAWARAYTTSCEKEGNKRCNSRKSPAWLSINSVNEYYICYNKKHHSHSSFPQQNPFSYLLLLFHHYTKRSSNCSWLLFRSYFAPRVCNRVKNCFAV